MLQSTDLAFGHLLIFCKNRFVPVKPVFLRNPNCQAEKGQFPIASDVVPAGRVSLKLRGSGGMGLTLPLKINASADIIKTGCDFFAEYMVNEAIKIIWYMARYATRQTERQKVADTSADTLKFIDDCHKNSVNLTKLVRQALRKPDRLRFCVYS